MPSVNELLHALPTEEALPPDQLSDELKTIYDQLQHRPVPVGAVQRLWRLGGLPASIGLAYGFHWLRGWFQDAPQRERDLAECHFAVALKLLKTMGYMRGAIMKVGQTLANFEDLLPDELVKTLEQLHFEAPPMHYALVREHLHDELGGDPETLFAEFETTAFAAASLGQVHRARLKTGEPVAIKVQYPGIGRTIRSDFRNLMAVLAPARLSKDWHNSMEQLEELRVQLEAETDYEREAHVMEKARALFTEDDGIVVPRVYRQFSTRRVLTMELLPGVHLNDYVALNPTQDERNAYATKMARAFCRLFYTGQLFYIDWHPGNVLFHEGVLGMLDFGGVPELRGRDWDLMERHHYAMQTGSREDLAAFAKDWCDISDEPSDRDRFERIMAYYEHISKPFLEPGIYDYSNADNLRRSLRMVGELTQKRYTRSHRMTLLTTRFEYAHKTIHYRLGAKIDVHPIRDEEVKATGWAHV